MAKDKVFGPKSKAAARRNIASAQKLLTMLDAYIEALAFEEEDDGDYDSRRSAKTIADAVTKMVDHAGNMLTIYCMDSPTDIVDLMRACIKQDDPMPKKLAEMVDGRQ